MVLRIGYYAQTEAYPPSELAGYCKLAEESGFDEVWAADHFHPWAHTGTSASFCWIFLTIAAERTREITLGTGVTAPTLRYNPALVAQAFATLGNVYPGRIFLGLGTGEAMNEVPVGYEWPENSERLARLEEAIKIIRMLWNKEFVSFKGKYYHLRRARLYTKQKAPIPIYVAANGPKTATVAGKYADGIVTAEVIQAGEYYKQTLFPALENGAKMAGRDPARIVRVMEGCCAYGPDYETSLETARKWAASALPFFFGLNVYDPRDIEALAKMVDPKDIANSWLISNNPDDHIKKIESFIKMGFSSVHMINLGTHEESFIKMYGQKVIPYLKDTYASKF